MRTNIQTMGVINITPNSFSDAGATITSDTLFEKWDYLLENNASIIDIGAESTAPFNSPVTEKEEMERFEKVFFPLIGTLKLPKKISIDTYRPSVFRFVYTEIKRLKPGQKFIWNDVSGVLDEEVWKVLKDYPDVDYVFGHTLTTDRMRTSHHMDEIAGVDLINELEDYFKKALAQFEKQDLKSRVIFDPLFGFSKSYEQNWELLNHLPALILKFPKDLRWLLGISKKSFLQKKLPSNINSLKYAEYLQTVILSRWLHQLNEQGLIIRVHDPLVVSISKVGAEFIENTL